MAKTSGDPLSALESDFTAPRSGDPAQLQSRAIQSELSASDREMARVLEDLVFVLIDKGVIMMTDLPKAAQEKIHARSDLRSRLGSLAAIVGEGDEILLP